MVGEWQATHRPNDNCKQVLRTRLNHVAPLVATGPACSVLLHTWARWPLFRIHQIVIVRNRFGCLLRNQIIFWYPDTN